MCKCFAATSFLGYLLILVLRISFTNNLKQTSLVTYSGQKLKTFYVIIYCILFFTFNFSDPRYEIRCCHSSILISLGLCWRHSFSSLHIADKIPFKPLCLAVMLKNESELHVYIINKNRPKNHIPCCHTLYMQHIPLKIIILTTWININFPFE